MIGIGAWILLADDKDEEDKASRLTSSHGLALVALGISISLDELAIGFTIGLAHLARHLCPASFLSGASDARRRSVRNGHSHFAPRAAG